MANQDRVNFVWAESALTTIPPIPVSEVAYRDTTQTPEQMEVGQQYDTIYNSARHNQLLFLITSVAKTLCENGIMPFLAGQAYAQYARCIFTDGLLYKASRAILANEQPYPTPGDASGVWTVETDEHLVPDSRRVIAGTGLTGGGPLSSDVTLSAKLDGKTTQAAANGAITVKDVAIGGNLGDLASARGQIGNYKTVFATGDDLNDVITSGTYAVSPGCANVPMNGPSDYYVLEVLRDESNANGVTQFIHSKVNTAGPTWSRRRISDGTWQPWQQLVQTNYIGDGIKISCSKALADGTGGLCILSVPEYEGATASAAGTSGLVPPAAAGQHESFLTGGGEYKPALTKISDSVSLEDSKTAASAKAVKAVYDRLEALRVSFLGVPRYWRSTTLPAGHVWANGDLALFSDWPELENLYRSGGLEGMLLSYDASPSTIAQYCGRWRLNASSPTGLYVPNLSERFINSTINTNAFGTANTAGVPTIVGNWNDLHVPIVEVPALGQSGAIIANATAFAVSSLAAGGTGYVWNGVNFDASRSNAVYGQSPTVMPASVNYPIIIYLGNHS